jgi:hypothetical protein
MQQWSHLISRGARSEFFDKQIWLQEYFDDVQMEFVRSEKPILMNVRGVIGMPWLLAATRRQDAVNPLLRLASRDR